MPKPKTCERSSPSIQPHIHRARAEFVKFLKANELLTDQPEIRLELGLVSVRLQRPVNFEEMRDLAYLFAADPDGARGKHQAKEDRRQAEQGVEYVPPGERTKLSGFGLLAKTTKMGAYSFNLPAGPTGADSFGTCPVSALGWPIKQYQKHVVTNDLADDAAQTGTIDEGSWICGSCYAMKGAYGSPTVIMIQELRRRFAMSFAGRPHELANWLTWAIRWAQVKSIRDLEKISGKLDAQGKDRSLSVPDPRFFRIHDAGDFGLGPWYIEAWLETCRRCAAPINIRLPASVAGIDPEAIEQGGTSKGSDLTLPGVNFWAATRAWSVFSGLEQYAKTSCTCIPPNLTMRPSALYFADRPPALNNQKVRLPLAEDSGQETIITTSGYAPGTAADCLTHGKSLGDWMCPAYAPTVPGHPRSAPGGCHKSRGPNADTDPNDQPAPKGWGCRACWLRRDMSVVYIKH